MKNPEKQPENAGAPHGPALPGKQKKRYVSPTFEWEQAFETMALACGKINTTQAQCKFNRKNS